MRVPFTLPSLSFTEYHFSVFNKTVFSLSFLRVGFVLYNKCRRFFPCCQQKENLFMFFCLNSCSLALPTALPPFLLALLSFHIPPYLPHPSVFPMENRGHCSNDYSDPVAMAIPCHRHALTKANSQITKLPLEKADMCGVVFPQESLQTFSSQPTSFDSVSCF